MLVLQRIACFVAKLGFRIPLYCSAPGKAILAFMPEDERKRIVATLKFIRYNDATIVSGSALMRELEKTAAAGYALDNGEQFDGVYCVGAPVFDRGGYPIASIWTTGLMMDLETSRVPELGEYARVCALKISRRLGYNGASERICSV